MGNEILSTATHTFNVYDKGETLIGVTELAIPAFNALTVEMEGSGILGKFSQAVMGQYESMELKIPFINLDDDIFRFSDPTEVIDLNLRVAQQNLNKKDGEDGFRNLRIAVRGKTKTFEPGTVKNGTTMNASITLELLYILIEIDGVTKLELDKLNSVYKVNGKDIMEQMRQYC